MGDVWAMVERLFTLPAMPATTPDPFSDLEKSLKDLRILVEDVKELIAIAEYDIRILKKQAPPDTQAIAPAVPVTSKAMPNPDGYFNVRMSPELAEQFNELAEQNEMSRAEVFRRAIGLYKLAKETQINGEEIIIRSWCGSAAHLTNI